MRGRFITFEGGEGGGKSTHAALLAQRLNTFGIETIVTREPGGSPGAEIIRHIILSGAAKPLGIEAETLLFAAARDDHIRNTIEPALAAGKWVICDRFLDSTRVYQGIVSKVNPRLIRGLERIVVGDCMPDVTFIMDVPAEAGLMRASRRRGAMIADRYEAETTEFHELIRQAFAILARQEPDRCVLIDASQPKPAVFNQIWSTIRTRFAVPEPSHTVESAAT
jgi:dTMP kinase